MDFATKVPPPLKINSHLWILCACDDILPWRSNGTRIGSGMGGGTRPTWSARLKLEGHEWKAPLSILSRGIQEAFSAMRTKESSLGERPKPPHSGPENLKKVQAKKLVKSNKSISGKKNFFHQNQFFAISKMAKNQFLMWEF